MRSLKRTGEYPIVASERLTDRSFVLHHHGVTRHFCVEKPHGAGSCRVRRCFSAALGRTKEVRIQASGRATACKITSEAVQNAQRVVTKKKKKTLFLQKLMHSPSALSIANCHDEFPGYINTKNSLLG